MPIKGVKPVSCHSTPGAEVCTGIGATNTENGSTIFLEPETGWRDKRGAKGERAKNEGYKNYG